MTCGVQCITCKVWIAFKDEKEHVRVKNDIEQRSVESIKNLVVLISLKRLICTRSLTSLVAASGFVSVCVLSSLAFHRSPCAHYPSLKIISYLPFVEAIPRPSSSWLLVPKSVCSSNHISGLPSMPAGFL